LDQALALASADSNHKSYRVALARREPPCIPFLGQFLTDLTFIADGNPDTVKTDEEEPRELINWSKRQAYCTVIESVIYYQQTHFNLRTSEPLQHYLLAGKLNVLMGEEEMHALSLKLEPRRGSLADQQSKASRMSLLQRAMQDSSGSATSHSSSSTSPGSNHVSEPPSFPAAKLRSNCSETDDGATLTRAQPLRESRTSGRFKFSPPHARSSSMQAPPTEALDPRPRVRTTQSMGAAC